MQKIVPHLWFDKEAKEATAFYVSIFPDSEIKSVTTISDTPSGDCDIVTFSLSNQDFMAISAGPYFKLNPSISFFAVFDNEESINRAWDKLSDGGKVLMPYDTYPWATKYGWVQDKYGLTWQLSMSEHHMTGQRITPMLMFTKNFAGKAQEAISYYTSVFNDGKIDLVAKYEKGEGDVEGYIKHARFTLEGKEFMAMDSTGPHDFIFNEAVSFVVNCETQEEIDYLWEHLSKVKESEQCGWCKDQFGVSWQVVPKVMEVMMKEGTPEQKARVTQAFLKMKKFDIKTLEEVYRA